MGKKEMTPTERAVKLALELRSGRRMTTREIAEFSGVTQASARTIVNRLQGILPDLKRIPEDGLWSKDLEKGEWPPRWYCNGNDE